MVTASGLRWILTLAFALPVLYGVWRVLLPRTGLDERVDHALHAAMGVCMVAMTWPWGMEWPAVPQVVLFSLGGLWFLAATPFRAGDRSRGGAALAAWPHVVMMGAMAWMVAAMGSAHTTSGHGESGGVHDMHGMEMSGDSGVAAMSLTGTGPRVTAALLAAALAVIGLIWLTRTLDQAKDRAEGGDDRVAEGGTVSVDTSVAVAASVSVDTGSEGALAHACHAAMALGMAVMFVLMV
ncbi:DUF5134 domain-containing protein [Streptomyces sp. M41]|uniref:DUF5134 domain-containing protein n=1 Tax=Streptomyces sp. M41 TaxID=3059412 RepID=UPI00374DB5DA